MRKLWFGGRGQGVLIAALVALGVHGVAFGINRKERRLQEFGSASKWDGGTGGHHKIKNNKELSENLKETILHEKVVNRQTAIDTANKLNEEKAIKKNETAEQRDQADKDRFKKEQLNTLASALHYKASTVDDRKTKAISETYVIDTAIDAAIESYESSDQKIGRNPRVLDKEIRSNEAFVEKARLIVSEYARATSGLTQENDSTVQSHGRNGFRGSPTSIAVSAADKIMKLGTDILKFAEKHEEPVHHKFFNRWIKH